MIPLVFFRAVCRKHELTQFELEMSSQDLVSKKQQRGELATGVNHSSFTSLELDGRISVLCLRTSPVLCRPCAHSP